MLYAHCRAQFEFAASGIDGKFRVPIVGKEPGPTKHAWYLPKGFKRDGSVEYSTKTRVYLGARFGHAVWAYVPMLLVSAYLCSDATVLLLAEATLAKRLEEVSVSADDVRDALRDSLILRATSRSARVKRFAYAFAGVLVSIGMWTSFVGLQWGFLHTSMGRPDCTNDGWDDDSDARWRELVILAIQVFVLLVEGVLSSPLLERCNRCSIDAATPGRNLDGADGADEVIVDTTAGIQRVQRVLVYPLGLGALLMVAGQAASGVRFGSYFADGLLGVAKRIDPTTGSEMPAFDPKILGPIVFDQTVATGAIAIVVGLVVGAALQRQLLRGVGCTSAVLFVAWLALVCVFALPLLVYAEIRSIFYDEDASLDCAHIPDEDYAVDKFVCRSRYFSLIGGGALVFGTVLAITAVGLLEAVAAMLRPQKRATVTERNPMLEVPLVFDRSLSSTGHADSGKLPRVFALRIKK